MRLAVYGLTALTLVMLIGISYITQLFNFEGGQDAVEELSLSQKEVGQFFMVGHWAETPVASTTALIQDHNLGGVIIMDSPDNPKDIYAWVNEWQSVASLPLFIAIDQEGGPVSRLQTSDYIQTGQRAISTAEEAKEIGLRRGQELAALGINMNFAPVLDTALHPDSFMYERVFPNRDQADELAAAMIKGMKEAGVIAVVKHFPGHPDTVEDSHLVLPEVEISKDSLTSYALPFVELIKNSDPQAIMTAHIHFPNIDGKPVTLSSYFLTDYLRGELNFDGLIITDDMSMDAIENTWSGAEASLMALKAGADMILFAAEPQKVVGALEAIKETWNDDLKNELEKSFLRLNRIKDSLK